MMIKTRKILVYSALMGAAFFTQACGSSAPPAVNFQTGGTAYPIGTTTYPGNAGAFSDACPSGYGATTVNTPNGAVEVCKVILGPYSVNTQAQIMSISGSGSNIVASGGVNSSVVVDAGDEIEIWSFGHYSIPGQSGCSGSGVTSNGDTSAIGNNGTQFYPSGSSNSDGLWYAFQDVNGNYDNSFAANAQCTSVNCVNSSQSGQVISVPGGTTAGSSSTYNLIMGYNNSSIQCGNMGMYYEILRCVDENGLTYPCN
jgi:hypothetical protein